MSDPTQGNADPKTAQGGGAPAAFTPEQLEQISQVAAQVVNSGFTARSKKLKEDIVAEFGKSLEPLTRRLEDMANAAPAAKSAKGGKGKDDPDDGAPDPKTASMQRQLDEMKNLLEDRERKIADADARQRAQSLRQSLTRTLSENGFTDPLRNEDAVDLLLARGQVKHDDDGNAVFVENEHSVLDLPTGIKAWAKSDRAKNFLPPTGARGSGDRPVQGGAGNKQGQGPQEVTATTLGLALLNELGGTPVAVG